jgi:hypothetical protein
VARHRDELDGQLVFSEPAELSPRIRRALRRGPRTRPVRRPKPPSSGGDQVTAPRALAEWHDMTPGERITAWAALRAWVCWLHDRYELATEDRLPRCWASHPGLIEELYALKAWREEIYSSPQPSGQAARYWHAELRQVLHAAATMYAAGCRTGHRAAPRLAASDTSLREQWVRADPLAGIPGDEIAAGRGGHLSALTTGAVIAQALDDGDAAMLPGMTDCIFWAGACWTPTVNGWVQVEGEADPWTD